MIDNVKKCAILDMMDIAKEAGFKLLLFADCDVGKMITEDDSFIFKEYPELISHFEEEGHTIHYLRTNPISEDLPVKKIYAITTDVEENND